MLTQSRRRAGLEERFFHGLFASKLQRLHERKNLGFVFLLRLHLGPLYGEIVRLRCGEFLKLRFRARRFLIRNDGTPRISFVSDFFSRKKLHFHAGGFLHGGAQLLLNLQQIALCRCRQTNPQRSATNENARESRDCRVLIHTAADHAVENILRGDHAGDFGLLFPVRPGFGGESFQRDLERFEPGIVQRTAFPTDQNSIFLGEVFVRPIEDPGLGVVLGKPVLHPVF